MAEPQNGGLPYRSWDRMGRDTGLIVLLVSVLGVGYQGGDEIRDLDRKVTTRLVELDAKFERQLMSLDEKVDVFLTSTSLNAAKIESLRRDVDRHESQAAHAEAVKLIEQNAARALSLQREFDALREDRLRQELLRGRHAP